MAHKHTRSHRQRLFPELPQGTPLDRGHAQAARRFRDGKRGKATPQYPLLGKGRRKSLDTLPQSHTLESS